MDNFFVEMPENLQTAAFLLGNGVNKFVPELLKRYFPGKQPWIIADENTYKAAGQAVYAFLQAAEFKPFEPYIFPADPRPHPDFAISQKLAAQMPENCVPVAVGSGVINDLVKCAAGICKIPYCCVATACSVDGYTSNGGAMTVEGAKKTVPCPAPYAIAADVDVLEKAPAQMFSAGYADLLAKVTAGADWIITDQMGFEPIRQDIWELIQKPLAERIADPSDMGKVFAGLASSGYGMQMYHDSRPASGAEHMFSHVWEMEGLSFNGEEVSHGFKVGIGTLAEILLLEYVIEHDFDELQNRMKKPLTEAERREEVRQLTASGTFPQEISMTAMKKYLTVDETLERRELIGRNWKAIQQRLRQQIVTFEKLRSMLKLAACPVKPSEIGLADERFLRTPAIAQLIRIRYTVLDLLYEAGLLDDACKSLEKML